MGTNSASVEERAETGKQGSPHGVPLLGSPMASGNKAVTLPVQAEEEGKCAHFGHLFAHRPISSVTAPLLGGTGRQRLDLIVFNSQPHQNDTRTHFNNRYGSEANCSLWQPPYLKYLETTLAEPAVGH